MEAHEAYLRLLGLALKGGFLLTGADAVQGAAYAKQARLILVSADASERTRRDAQFWSERGQCLLLSLPCGKADLGAALGRGTASVVALTDIGFSAAVAERLAALDSETYGAIAERFKLKARRAKERRANRTNGARRIQTKARPRPADRNPETPHSYQSDRKPRPQNVADRNPRRTTEQAPHSYRADGKSRPRNLTGGINAKSRRNASGTKSAVRGRPPNRKDKPRPAPPAKDDE